MKLDELLNYFQEFGATDPEFFRSGAVVDFCQDYLVSIIGKGYKIDELIWGNKFCENTQSDVYSDGMEFLVATAIAFPGKHVADIITWAADYNDVGISDLNTIITNIYNNIQVKLGEKHTGEVVPVSDIYSSKCLRLAFEKFYPISDSDQLMKSVEADNYSLVNKIVVSAASLPQGHEHLYLHLAKYNETLNVRFALTGTKDLTRAEIHGKLLGLFSISDKRNRSLGSTHFPRWDIELIEVPAVRKYLSENLESVLRDVLDSRDPNSRFKLHDGHVISCSDRQVELISTLVSKGACSPDVCARLYYTCIKGENQGYVLDLLDCSDWLNTFCVDLLEETTEKPLYEQVIKDFIGIIGTPRMVKAVKLWDDERADNLLSALYRITGDDTIPPQLKSLAARAEAFTQDLGI